MTADFNCKISTAAQQILQHESVDGWKVICAGRCWSFPGQSTTDKRTLLNSHPVVSKKTRWWSHHLFTKKETVVSEENLYVFQGELIGIQCLPATAVPSYFVCLHVLYSWPNSFYVDTQTALSWRRHVNGSKVGNCSRSAFFRNVVAKTDTNKDLICAAARP